MTSAHYDAIVIGAGMSGMAAAIRLAMFDKKVCLLEKHSIAGGLNSYYQRRDPATKALRQFDVGLHALTNYVPKGSRGHPLNKLLKQLRIGHDQLDLCPQSHSVIAFNSKKLQFSNDFELLSQSIKESFPDDHQDFLSLVGIVQEFNELDLNLEYQSTRDFLGQHFKNPLLVEMILAPLLIYGSAWKHDMDFAQFVVMFKSIYLEGFARPSGGVRKIIDLLLQKLDSLGVEVRFREGVEKILLEGNKVKGVETKKGFLPCSQIFSSMGLPETLSVVQGARESQLVKKPAGEMTFVETIMVFDQKPIAFDFTPTIVFYNQGENYNYRPAKNFFDAQSAVFCCPDNYQLDDHQGEGVIRVTFMANYQQWKSLARAEYLQKKQEVYEQAYQLVKRLIPHFNAKLLYKDVFTPTTIERYTWHQNGAVYGSPEKSRKGLTDFKGLYIIGTDQGFLGIIGAMLSGISIANLYGLMQSEA